MRIRWLAAVLILAGPLLSVFHGFAQPSGRNITQPVVIEDVEFVEMNTKGFPPDNANWQRTRLPDDWSKSRPGYSGRVWYRVPLPHIDNPRRIHLIYLSRDSADLIRFIVNRKVVGSTERPDPILRLNQRPYTTGINPAALRDSNTMHILVEGHSALHHGLARVWFGDSAPMRAQWLGNYQLYVLLPMGCAFAALAVGVMALTFWFRNRRDSQYFWAGLAAVIISAPTLAHFYTGPGEPGIGRDILQLLYAYGAAPALVASGLHMTKVERRGLIWILWGVLAVGSFAPLLFGRHAYLIVWAILGVIYLLALVAVFTLVLLREGQHGRWVRGTMALALAAVIVFAVHDLGIWAGWIDFDRIMLSPFSATMFTLALGTLVISRHLDAMQGLTRANATLEQRVAERTVEIERAHEQLRAFEQEHARVAERQRIMGDIHDGLGASLVSLLSVVQTRHAEPAEVERRVHDALQELRLAVDSQDTMDGDLLTALATIRFRMRDALEAAGITLEWDVTDIPPLDHLSSRHLLGVQRIVLEALTNAIRHAKATCVSVSLVSAADHVAILIIDNGRGFDAAAQVHLGRGLAGMRRRANAAGFTLRIESATERGTRITLTLPLKPPSGKH